MKIGTLVKVSEPGMEYSGFATSGINSNIGIIIDKSSMIFDKPDDCNTYEDVRVWIVMIKGLTEIFYQEDLSEITTDNKD